MNVVNSGQNFSLTVVASTTAIPTLQQVVTASNTVDGNLAQSLDAGANIGVNNGLIQLNSNTSNLSVSDSNIQLNTNTSGVYISDAGIDLSSASVTKNNVEIATTINYYNVKDYGAAGDGVTDDYTAINNAITASIAGNGAVNLIFPYGTYKVGTQLSIDNATITVNIIGNGSTLKSNISTVSTAILFVQSAKKINIDRLTFDINSLTTSNHRCLRIGDNTNSKFCGIARITNCDFTGFGQESQVGVWVQNTPYINGLAGNQNLPSLLIDGCNFYNQNTTATVNYTTMTNYGVGLRIGEQTDYARVSNCNFNYIRIGVWSEAAGNLDLTGCNFLACLPKQSSVYTYGALYIPNSGTNNGKINVVACKFNHNYGYSIYFAYATAERPLTVSSCHFIANATTAIYATHTSTVSTRIKINDNYFERCSQAFTNSWTAQPFGASLQPFIYLNNQLRCVVRLNTFLNDATYGVTTAGSSDYNLIKNNNWFNITGASSVVGANNVVSDNDNL